MLCFLVRIGKLSEKDAAEIAGMSIPEFKRKAALIPNYA